MSPLSLLSFLACTGPGATDDTAACAVPDAVGWSEASHAKGDADYDQVFALDRVQRLDLTICASDYAAMLDDLDTLLGDMGGPGDGGPPDGGGGPPEGGGPSMDFDEPMWVSATVAYDGRTWPAVGMRFKGNSSLLSSYQEGIAKLPLRLDFDQYEDSVPATEDQRFYGFQKLSLGPGYADDSFLREVLAGELFEAAGIPVARSAFVEVWIDAGEGPTYWGLYTVVEDPENAAFLDRTFGDDDGNLYQPEDGCADWTCFAEADFSKETNADAADWSDVEAAIEALAADQGDAEAWRAALEARFDVEGFLRWLALSTAVGNWDSYGNMPHNYFLYGDPAADGQLAWITWDHNMSLADGMQPLISLDLGDVGDEWPLIRTLLDDPTYAARYDVLLAEHQGVVNVEAFAARAQTLHALVAPYVAAEAAPYTHLTDPDAFDTSVDDLVDWMETRDALVSDHLAR
ncbi:MAG: CotH kinase family protein [Myxococcota bacterium]